MKIYWIVIITIFCWEGFKISLSQFEWLVENYREKKPGLEDRKNG